MQRFFILCLLGRYEKAQEAYARAVSTASKLGMPGSVTELAVGEAAKGEWKEYADLSPVLEALRATLNEDHFLFFMAHYKSYGEEIPEAFEILNQKVLEMGRFAAFAAKHESLLAAGKPHDILYQTHWARRGMKEPEEVLKWMETVGEAPAIDDEAILQDIVVTPDKTEVRKGS